jgi:hypothetical protein
MAIPPLADRWRPTNPKTENFGRHPSMGALAASSWPDRLKGAVEAERLTIAKVIVRLKLPQRG